LKLFQIEEPDGSPPDDGVPGLAIGIDLSTAEAAVAASLGGNAEILRDRDGADRLTLGALRDAGGAWNERNLREALLALRAQAEKALARPATHAVAAIAGPVDDAAKRAFFAAGEGAGLAIVRLIGAAEAAAASGCTGRDAAALGAAALAEDLTAPRG
jgi:Ethanolamine utilization protein EutJ (predicted chaperonin)